MPIRVTAEQATEKHASRLKGATTFIRNGVNAVTESPTEKAASKQDKMLQNLTEAVQSGKWAAGLRRVSLQQWKTAMTEVGIPRIPAGVDAAHDKILSFYRDLFSYMGPLISQVESMPDLTLEDNIQRAVAFMRGMSNFSR